MSNTSASSTKVVSIDIRPVMLTPPKRQVPSYCTAYETIFLVGVCCAACVLIIYIQSVTVCSCKQIESSSQRQKLPAYRYGAYDYMPLASGMDIDKVLPESKQQPPSDMEKYPHLDVRPRSRLYDDTPGLYDYSLD